MYYTYPYKTAELSRFVLIRHGSSNICYFIAIKDPDHYIPTPGVTPSHDCDNGYLANGEGCYKLVSQPMNWADAKTNCENDGAYLVTMDSAAENAAAALFAEYSSQVLWAGMYKDLVSAK